MFQLSERVYSLSLDSLPHYDKGSQSKQSNDKMSTHLTAERYYIHLLLNTTSRLQAKALLYTATPLQVRVLCEIALNIRRMTPPKSATSKLKKHKGFLTKLAQQRQCKKKQLILIQDNYSPFLAIIRIFKKDIQQLI